MKVDEQTGVVELTADEVREAFTDLYPDVVDFVRQISQMRRGDFLTGWHYEVEVRKTADVVLRRLRDE